MRHSGLYQAIDAIIRTASFHVPSGALLPLIDSIAVIIYPALVFPMVPRIRQSIKIRINITEESSQRERDRQNDRHSSAHTDTDGLLPALPSNPRLRKCV